MIFCSYYQSCCGKMLIAATEQAVCGIWFENQKHYAYKANKNMQKNDNLPIFIKTKKWLDDYFAGKNPDAKEIPVVLHGSDFQQKVWSILQTIEYGKTMTYGQISKLIERQSGKKMSAQAVGGAVGHNPVSIIVPCHRVLGANKNLTGYAAGLDIKTKLLKIEGIL